jgi:hypothetical protein
MTRHDERGPSMTTADAPHEATGPSAGVKVLGPADRTAEHRATGVVA